MHRAEEVQTECSTDGSPARTGPHRDTEPRRIRTARSEARVRRGDRDDRVHRADAIRRDQRDEGASGRAGNGGFRRRHAIRPETRRTATRTRSKAERRRTGPFGPEIDRRPNRGRRRKTGSRDTGERRPRRNSAGRQRANSAGPAADQLRGSSASAGVPAARAASRLRERGSPGSAGAFHGRSGASGWASRCFMGRFAAV